MILTIPMESISRGQRIELSLLIAATLALCLEILILLFQLRLIYLPYLEEADSGGEKEIGALVLVERNITNRAWKSLTWYPMIQGDRVRLFDTLRTGSHSKATVKLSTGGEVVLDEDALVHFSEQKKWGGEETIHLVVNQGAVRVGSTKRHMEIRLNKRKLVLSPESEVQVVSQALEASSRVEVKKGTASLVALRSEPGKKEKGQEQIERSLAGEKGQEISDEPVLLKEGDSLKVAVDSGRIVKEEKFELERVSPGAGMRILASTRAIQEGGQKISFVWDKKKGDMLEWDIDKNLSSARRVNEEDIKNLKFSPGKYYWRIRRGLGLSAVQDFLVVPAVEYGLLSPKSGKILKISGPFILKWKPFDQADSYLVELGTKEDFSEVMVRKEISGSEFDTGQLKPGRYYWRIQARSEKWGEWHPSRIESFSVKKRLKAPKPKGVKIRKKTRNNRKSDSSRTWEPLRRLSSLWDFSWEVIIPSAYAFGEKDENNEAVEVQYKSLVWEFAWEPVQGVVDYLLEISPNKNFKKVVKRERVSGLSVELELPFSEEYYWRVAAIDEDGERGHFTAVQIAKTPKEKKVHPLKALAKVETNIRSKTPSEVQIVEKELPLRAKGLGWIIPSWIRLGASGSYMMQKIQSPSYEVENRGLPLRRLHAYLHRSVRYSEIELGLWYEPLFFRSDNPSFSDFQTNLRDSHYGITLLGKGVSRVASIPWTVGIGVERFLDFGRLTEESVGITSLGYGYLLWGVCSAEMLLGGLFWQNALLIEGAPLGRLKGIGLWLRSRLGFARGFSFLTSEAQFLLRVSYRELSSESKKYVLMDASLALILGTLLDSQPSYLF